MFVHLAPSIHRNDVYDHRVAVHSEQYAPVSHARLSNPCALGEWRRESWLEGVVTKQIESRAEAALSGTVEPVKNFLGFVRDDTSQSAFAFIFVERLDAPRRDIGHMLRNQFNWRRFVAVDPR